MKSSKFKVTDHELVPRHEVVPVDEAIKILRELGVRPDQLPLMRASDPVAREIGAKPGDLVKIIRNSPTAGKIIVYRYVVAG